MPYIRPERRPEFDPHIEALACKMGEMGFKRGDLNYVLTRTAKCFLHDWKGPDPSYDDRSAVRGVLADVDSEWYRRMLATPYEDGKIATNGDVLP